MDSKLTMVLIIILVLDVIFFLTQTAMIDINPEGSSIYSYEDSFISDFDKGNYTLIGAGEGMDILPEGSDSVSSETGNIFTDTFKTTSNWLKGGSKGLTYFTNFLGGPVTFLRAINVPQQVTFSIGALWYILTAFLLIAFILGR